MSYQRRRCRKFFSRTTGTMLVKTKVNNLKLAVAGHLLAAHYPNVTSAQLADWLEFSEKTARRLVNLYQAAIVDAP